MSIKWWQRYLRTSVVLGIAIALIILYAVPVTFTSLLAKVSILGDDFPWLAWLENLPPVAIYVIQVCGLNILSHFIGLCFDQRPRLIIQHNYRLGH